MNYMNTRHSNMRFTYESESNDCIHFIGLTITHLTENNRHKYLTSVYRKPTSTSLFMNFNSFEPLMHRLSVFKCLVSRAIQLCSTWSLFHVEIDQVLSMLLRNAYPSWLLDRIVKNAVSSFLSPNVKFGPQKERLYIGLPFLGKSTDSLRKSIKEFASNSFQIKISSFILSPAVGFPTFSMLRTSHLLNCVLVSYTNLAALAVRPTMWVRRPDTLDTE